VSGSRLISPLGGELVDLLVTAERAEELRTASLTFPSWDLNIRQLSDLEMLLSGGFSPLTGFMRRQDYESVCEEMRLDDGTLWPIPVTLDLPASAVGELEPGELLALRDPEGFMLAVLHVEEIWLPDRAAEAKSIYGTADVVHPGAAQLVRQSHPWYVGGRLEGLSLPQHHDFLDLRHTPAQLREHFAGRGWERILSFQTTAPLHRVHHSVLTQATEAHDAALLINPVVGMTRPGHLAHYTKGRCYRAVLPRFPEASTMLSMVPLAMRMGGPRDTLLRAIVCRNQGCTHLLVGWGDGPGFDSGDLVRQHEAELGIIMVPFPPEDAAEESAAFPEVAAELARSRPARHKRGFAVFFSGLSGAGKSTVANVLMSLFLEQGERPVTLLDGDLVRKFLSSELGFSKEHRDVNIRRIGFVASEITKNGGIALCAPIAPYDAVRKEVRELIVQRAGFILVHVSTPLEECEKRDRKGLYAKARAGIIRGFTGISDPYEVPADAEIVLDTTGLSPLAAAQRVMEFLVSEGYIIR
jgi:sulfate adenylyltransferase